ncbi:MAG: aldo/keto reductase [Caldilineaceae bacterium]|nr:aldo/keto reductase [Caldilineaceae bacterium]
MNNFAGFATQAGTLRYIQRFTNLAGDHFRPRYGLQISSIGVGTYLGGLDAITSAGYVDSVMAAVEGGCNLIDSAINYRHMQSERDVGAALARLFATGQARRDELIVCTKGGFLPFDGAPPADRLAFVQAQIEALGLAPLDMAGGLHCIAPTYLSQQIGLSLHNLGLKTLDVYYLHNPETQLRYVTLDEFWLRLRAAFERLEQEAADGRIRFYGIAAWDGFAADPNAKEYLPLYQMIELARQMGGEKHRFRFLQFPYNLGTLDAVVKSNQPFEREREGKRETLLLPLLAAARQYALVAIGSAGLMQKQVLENVPDEVMDILGGWQSDAQAAIHFNRSTPGLTATLVGMSQPAHVEENLRAAERSAIEPGAFWELLKE